MSSYPCRPVSFPLHHAQALIRESVKNVDISAEIPLPTNKRPQGTSLLMVRHLGNQQRHPQFIVWTTMQGLEQSFNKVDFLCYLTSGTLYLGHTHRHIASVELLKLCAGYVHTIFFLNVTSGCFEMLGLFSMFPYFIYLFGSIGS